MLSVVIATQDCERALLTTLAALVAGAMAGLVREVIVADAGSQDATLAIAEEAGCQLLTLSAQRGGRLRAAAELARADWLLFIKPGIALDPAWITETRRFLRAAEHNPKKARPIAQFRLRAPTSAGLAGQLFWSLRAALGGARGRGHTLLITKELYRALGGHRDVGAPEADLARRIGSGRLTLLAATGAAADT